MYSCVIYLFLCTGIYVYFPSDLAKSGLCDLNTLNKVITALESIRC